MPVIEITNPDLKILIDTILYMDSLCEKSDIEYYMIAMGDTIVNHIRYYNISVTGRTILYDMDTTKIYGCFIYRNRSFFFWKPYIQGVGIAVTDQYHHFKSQEMDVAMRHDIPLTICSYSLGRMWILERLWLLSDQCGDYEYPIVILSVTRN